MNVILTAGGSPAPTDPMHALTRGGIKAMLNIAGRPMIQWMLDALGEARTVERIYVVGLSPMSDLNCKKPLTLLADQNDRLDGLKAGADALRADQPEARHALLLTCDIPAIPPAAIDWMVETVEQSSHDFYYTFIDRTDMEARFPQARRAYSQLKDRQVCSGSLSAFRLDAADARHPFLEKLLQAHKSPLRQVSLIGYDTMFLLLMRQLTLQEAEKSINHRLKIDGRALLCPYAEAGMDLVHPGTFELLQNDLQARPRNQ